MKKMLFILPFMLAAAAQAALPEEKTLLALGRGEAQGLGLTLNAAEAGQAAKGLLDYLAIKDNCPTDAESAKAHKTIAAQQDAASGQAAGGQGTPEEWKTALYVYGQEAGARLYEAALSKEEAAVVAGSFAQALRGEAAPGNSGEGAGMLAFMAARRAASLKGQRAFFDKMAREPGAVKMPSGSLFIPRKEGSGPAPKPFYWVKVSGQSRLWDGKLQSVVNAAEEMQLPPAGFITEALLKMKTGGRATLVSPPGPAENGAPIMSFDVELLSVREGKEPEPEPEQQAAEPQPEAPEAGPAADKTVDELIADYNRTGSSAAAFAAGLAYKTGGSGAAIDVKKAFIWFSRAAAKKNADAAFELGGAYANGEGVQSSQAESAKWYARAAEWGSPEGMAAIGSCYRYGMGVKKDWKEAVKWYARAAEGVNEHWLTMGDLHLFADDEADKNRAEALKWYAKAFDEAGMPEGATGAGNAYRLGGYGLPQDYAKAAEWYKKGAERGSSLSMMYLSEAYDAGEGVAKNPGEAYKWYLVYMAKGAMQQHNRDTLKKLEAALAPAEKDAAKKQAQALIDTLVTAEDRENKAYLESLPGN